MNDTINLLEKFSLDKSVNKSNKENNNATDKHWARTTFQSNMLIVLGSLIGMSLHFIKNINLISYSLQLALTIHIIY
ncbi:Uncharacterised protein [Staphylococcus epidermidis]|nr:Uncharacterised protein [Staphylococcus epidermidis]